MAEDDFGCSIVSFPSDRFFWITFRGELTLADFDTVDTTNLGRQVLFGPGDIGEPKAAVAADRLAQQNPGIRIRPLTDRLDDKALWERVAKADVVLDCTDNFATRFQVNDACVEAGRCLVSGSAIRFEGQLAVFGPDYTESPCYRCLYSDESTEGEACSQVGVLAPMLGIIGSIQATEAVRVAHNIRQITIAPLLGDAMSRISQESSVSSLFD